MLVTFMHTQKDASLCPVAQTEMPTRQQLSSLQKHKKLLNYNQQSK